MTETKKTRNASKGVDDMRLIAQDEEVNDDEKKGFLVKKVNKRGYCFIEDMGEHYRDKDLRGSDRYLPKYNGHSAVR